MKAEHPIPERKEVKEPGVSEAVPPPAPAPIDIPSNVVPQPPPIQQPEMIHNEPPPTVQPMEPSHLPPNPAGKFCHIQFIFI